jgi:hypothetical protein
MNLTRQQIDDRVMGGVLRQLEADLIAGKGVYAGSEFRGFRAAPATTSTAAPESQGTRQQLRHAARLLRKAARRRGVILD